MSIPKKDKGFTIIEVVLVLAIAGLIFLVVFLALPALQRSQRDSQRKSDLGRLMSQITAYASNNQGSLPYGNWTNFLSGYMTNGGQTFSDPTSASTYTITQQTTTSGAGAATGLTAGNIFIYPGVNCSNVSAGTGTISTTSRTVAAAIYQEQGTFTCENN